MSETMIVINMSEAGRRLTVAGDPALLRRLLETIGNPADKTAERPAALVAPAGAMTSAPGAALSEA